MATHEDKDFYRLKAIVTKVSETSKIKIDEIIKKFQLDARITDFTFPSALTSHERAYVHAQCGSLGLKSMSNGTGDNRRITINKPKESNQIALRTLELSTRSMVAINAIGSTICQNKPQNLLAIENGGIRLAVQSDYTNRVSTGPTPKIPKVKLTRRFDQVRQRLPIWKHQEEILKLIENYKVVFIKGDTGSGKTTQVPQFILDDATAKQKPVRILCTVPRRIAAVTISDRVATERGERCGSTVGYQIRLESCFSPCDTLLTYCTSGVLLRSLTSFDYSVLKNTTHIILDEVHERDRQTDFLLACIRDVGLHFPNLRLILMGADMDNQLLTSYFGGPTRCPMIQVKGQLYPVNILFLEDVLSELDYQNYEMQRMDKKGTKTGHSNKIVENNLVEQFRTATQQLSWKNTGVDSSTVKDIGCNTIEDERKLRNATLHNVDELIQNVWVCADTISYDRFIKLVTHDAISVNYQHSNSSITMLMSLAVRGWAEQVKQLLSMGADSSVSMLLTQHGRYFTAKDWAVDHGHPEIAQILTDNEFTEVFNKFPGCTVSSDSDKIDRLMKYQASVDEERVDLLIILKLLNKIHRTTEKSHAILVFLPGYDEIVTLKQMLFFEPEMRSFADSLIVFLLHSNIQSGDQKVAFERPRKGVRKILLSTNIAETSLTIEDVVYVIDSGKVKEKSFDSMTGVSQLKSNWISKASANQRQGRAGRCRPGVCYRLYSYARYKYMAAFPTPEIIRTSLQELCLYTRSFIRGELKIADFFGRLPEPPAPIAIKKAVDMLISMGAIDENEHLTKLGMYLLDLPLEPSLGKALIYGVVLKCLDPVLTIISMISYRDPFQLPSDPNEKKKALAAKVDFSSGSMSDHMAALKAFQEWEKSKLFREDTERNFCRQQFLSSACFDMIYGIRSQLLGQLRASGFIASKGAGDLKDINTNSNNWAVVKAVLVATLFPNVCAVNREKKCLFNEFEKKITFHPSSTVIYKKEGGISVLPVVWVLYDEMCQQGINRLIRGCTVVGDLAMALFAGNYSVTPKPYDDGCVAASAIEGHDNLIDIQQMLRFDINSWISIKGTKRVIEMVIFLREQLYELILTRLKCPSYSNTQRDNTILQTIAMILVFEDEEHGLENVEGIGQWPKLVSGNLMSAPRTGFGRLQATLVEDENDSNVP